MFNFFNKYLIVTTVFLFTSAFCKGNLSNNKKYYDQGYPIEKHHLMKAYNTPARTNTNGCIDLFAQGSFIYWQPKEKGLTIGASNSANLTTTPVKIFNLKSNYKPGFKTALGFHSNEDDWTILAEYTRFHQKTNNTINKDLAFTSDWLSSSNTNITAIWDLDFDLLELGLSRKNYTSKHLIISPMAAITGGWLDQKYTLNNLLNNSLAESDSWFIGPKAGVSGFWQIKGNFKIFTDISAALFYQDFYKVLYKENVTSTSVTVENISTVDRFLLPNLNLSAGLNYGICFKNYVVFDFLVKYDFMNFWNQNQMRNLLNHLKFTRFNAGSLMLHGLTASMKIDF